MTLRKFLLRSLNVANFEVAPGHSLDVNILRDALADVPVGELRLIIISFTIFGRLDGHVGHTT